MHSHHKHGQSAEATGDLTQQYHKHNHNEHKEHDKHAGHSVAMFKGKFWLSLILTIPVLAYSEMIQHWFGFSPPTFPGSQYVPFVLSTVIFFMAVWCLLKVRGVSLGLNLRA